MTDEKQQNEFAEKVEVTLKNIRVDMFDGEAIKKITFETDKGNVTWKPKVDKKTFQGGLELHNLEAMKITAIPDKLAKMASGVQDEGTVDLEICYAIFNKEVDGEEVSYRYIQSLKTFDKWIIKD